MKIDEVELRRISLGLVSPFQTSFGTESERDILLVRVAGPDGEGWGECTALSEPAYSAEYVEGAAHVIRHHLLPRLFAVADPSAHLVGPALADVKGHPMAKAALEMAILDAELRIAGVSFGAYLGAVRDRVPAGVSVGIAGSVAELLDTVGAYLDQGYVRVKLKIQPGWDVAPVQAVRERFGDDVALQVDANTSYTLADARHLARLDAFDLLLIEQPLPEDDLAGHAVLAAQLRTPICLDESITSARAAAEAITRGDGSAATSRPGGSTTSARPMGSRSGAAGCWKPGWGGPPTWPWLRCPTSGCPGTPRPRTATGGGTSPHPSVSRTGISPSRPGRAWGLPRTSTRWRRRRPPRLACPGASPPPSLTGYGRPPLPNLY
jgi:O-succinylbenzoate synthase